MQNTKCIVAFPLQQLIHERATVLRHSAIPVFLHVIYITDNTYPQYSKSSTQHGSDKCKLDDMSLLLECYVARELIRTPSSIIPQLHFVRRLCSVRRSTSHALSIHRYRVQLILVPILIPTRISKDTDVYHILLLELYRR